MKLELPSAKSSEVARVEKLVLYISSDGEIVFADRAVPLDSLEIVLTNSLSLVEEKTLVLKADKMVPHGTVVSVMDIAKRVGLKKLVVGTTIEDD